MAALGSPGVEERNTIGFLTLYARSGVRKTQETWVRRSSPPSASTMCGRRRRSRGREDHADRVRRTFRVRIRARPQMPA